MEIHEWHEFQRGSANKKSSAGMVTLCEVRRKSFADDSLLENDLELAKSFTREGELPSVLEQGKGEKVARKAAA